WGYPGASALSGKRSCPRRAMPIDAHRRLRRRHAPMSLLSHRASRGLAYQLLVPLALAAVLVLSVVGGVLTLDARDAAKDGLVGQARAIDAAAAPLVAPAHGKRPRGWASTLQRLGVPHQSRVTVT